MAADTLPENQECFGEDLDEVPNVVAGLCHLPKHPNHFRKRFPKFDVFSHSRYIVIASIPIPNSKNVKNDTNARIQRSKTLTGSSGKRKMYHHSGL